MAHQGYAVILLLITIASAQKMLAHDPWPRRFVWIGGTTEDSFKIHIDIEPGDEELIVTPSKTNLAAPGAKSVRRLESYSDLLDLSIYKRLRKIEVEKLTEKRLYYIFMVRGANAKKHPNVTFPVGSIKTFPAPKKPAKVTVALGSCQGRAKDSRTLHEIGSWSKHLAETQKNMTFFMLHMGDLHYGNIGRNDDALFESAMRDVVTDSVGRQVFRNTHISYGWDDHDYGANNADANSLSRPAALRNYRSMVPYYKPGKFDAAYHAFTVANYRFIITDLRSEASSKLQQAMSPDQEKWLLLTELINWNKFDAVIWMSSRPWIDGAQEGSDTWGGFARQRHRIANFIASKKIDNLIVVSGDAHMLAADDGTNSYYADEKLGHTGFPVLQAAPLAKYGSSKGGPYTEGCIGYRLVKNYHYAILTLEPTNVKKGGTRGVAMEFKGYHAMKTSGKALEKKVPLLTLSMHTPFLATKVTTGGGNGSCSISLAPWWYYVTTLLVFVGIVLGINFCVSQRKAQKNLNTIGNDDHPNEPLAPM